MGRWAGTIVAILLMVAVSGVSACKKQKGLGEVDPATGSLGEEGLSGDGRAGSLNEAKSGAFGGGGPLEDVLFDYDSFELAEDSRLILKRNAEWLTSNRGARVEIEGHCDERGTVEYNLALGSKRAAAAKSYLISLGIAPDRLTTISYGEELPLCHDPTESCWQQNRRARLVVTNN